MLQPPQHQQSCEPSVVRQAGEDAEALALIELGMPTVCFGAIPESSVADGAALVLLRTTATDTELACRLGHLLAHVHDPLPPPDPSNCAGWLAVVEEKERRAHELEARLRARFGLAQAPPLPLPELMRHYEERCR